MSQVSFVKRHAAFEHKLQHYPLNISLSSLLLFVFYFKIEQSLDYNEDATIQTKKKKKYKHTLPRSVEKALSTRPPYKSLWELPAFIFEMAKQDQGCW